MCGCLARCFCTVMDSKAFLGVCCLSAYDTWTSADEYTTYTITTTKTNKINTKSKLMCTGKGGAFPLHLNEDSLDFVHDGLCLLPLADLCTVVNGCTYHEMFVSGTRGQSVL